MAVQFLICVDRIRPTVGFGQHERSQTGQIRFNKKNERLNSPLFRALSCDHVDVFHCVTRTGIPLIVRGRGGERGRYFSRQFLDD